MTEQVQNLVHVENQCISTQLKPANSPRFAGLSPEFVTQVVSDSTSAALGGIDDSHSTGAGSVLGSGPNWGFG